MKVRELRPRHRNHFARRIQLHRARTERNHRRVESDVLPFETLQIPHHLGLGMMRVEDRMREERRRPSERWWIWTLSVVRRWPELGRSAEDPRDVLDVADRGGLVE